MEFGNAIVHEAGEAVLVVTIGAALERAEANMAFREAHENAAPGRGGLVIARELFAGFDEAEGLGCVDAKRFEISRGEDLTHTALERQAAVTLTRPGRLAGALGAEIEEVSGGIPHLCVEESASVSQLGVVGSELVTVIAHRQWALQVAGQGLESGEVV